MKFILSRVVKMCLPYHIAYSVWTV